jgi:hypothetical protein
MSKSKDAVQFLLESLDLVAGSQGNPQQIYPIWAQQLAGFNVELLAVLPTVVMQIFEQQPEQRALLTAVLGQFGDLINQFPLGNRWLNLELGITAYELTLQVYARDCLARTMGRDAN